MPSPDQRALQLRRLAFACALLLLAVGVLSATLRLDKLGLSCAGWPACYGQALRDAQRGLPPADEVQAGIAAARLAHRVVASAALLLIVMMVLICMTARPPREVGRPPSAHGPLQPSFQREGRLAGALLALALALSVLGWWSATVRVPLVSLGNLLGGFVMLALCVRLAAPDAAPPPPLRRWARVAIVVLLLQIAFGGLVSASHAGLSCTGWAGCGPAQIMQGDVLAGLDPLREPRVSDAPPFNADGALAHMLHRVLAIATSLLIAVSAVLAWRTGRRAMGAALIGCVALQLATGFAMVVAGLPLAYALLHNVIAAATLALLARWT